MYQILDQARRGQLGVYLQFLVILLILSAGITYAMAMVGPRNMRIRPQLSPIQRLANRPIRPPLPTSVPTRGRVRG